MAERRATRILAGVEAPPSFAPDQREYLGRLAQAIERGLRDMTAPAIRGAEPAFEYELRGVTANATITEIFVNADGAMPARMSLPANSTWAFHALVAARRLDAANESAGYELKGVIDNNSGTVALVGTVAKTVLAEDIAAWDADIDASNGALRLRVTGENAKTVGWVARVRLAQAKT